MAELLEAVSVTHGHLKAQAEELLLDLRHLRIQLLVVQVPDLLWFHIYSTCSRATHLVAIGSLWAARRMADSATSRVTPSISNKTFPGRITATHCSGAPLPFPIRVSAGFLVIGLSGNRRIQTLPPRLMKRVMA